MRAAHDWCLAIVLFVAAGLPGCSSSDAGAQSVPGTYAWVNDHRVGPLHEGQYVGQLEPIDGACKGESGSGAGGSTSITLHIDERCRVFVDAIDP